ncbi:hypothetical protein [Trinickia sp.]|uniref:hypothetical protein n=1 Tax=Trinickia sp. TaxID=2571163 RepID=UPI003F8181F0
MLPKLNQFRRWTYPNKFGFVTFFIAITVAIASFLAAICFWLFPDFGKELGDMLISGRPESVVIPGDNAIEKAINKAKMKGINSTDPSTDFAVAIPFARPSLSKSAETNYNSDIVALSNASALRSSNQDLVFAAGRCRFLGTVSWSGQTSLIGTADITGVSCVMDNRDSYNFSAPDGHSIGYLTPVDQPASREISLAKEGPVVTLPEDGVYLVRFTLPLRSMSFTGKSSIAW